MAQNFDFKKFTFKDVKLVWPRLDQQYRFDQHKKESVPCQPNAPMAAYSTGFILSNEVASQFEDQAREHYDMVRMRKPDMPEYSGIFGMKKLDGNDAGFTQFTAKRNAIKKDGDLNKPPSVIDAAHNDLADKAIWSGSIGHVRFLIHPTDNPQDGSGGISILLDAVCVTKPEYGGNNFAEDFGEPVDAFANGGPSDADMPPTPPAEAYADEISY